MFTTQFYVHIPRQNDLKHYHMHLYNSGTCFNSWVEVSLDVSEHEYFWLPGAYVVQERTSAKLQDVTMIGAPK